MDEQKLEDLAVEEILKDLKRGAERAKEHGAMGWQKNPAPPPNKRFLLNMLVSTLRDTRPIVRTTTRLRSDHTRQHHSSTTTSSSKHPHSSSPGRRSYSESQQHFCDDRGKSKYGYHQRKDRSDGRNYSRRYHEKRDGGSKSNSASHNDDYNRYHGKKSGPGNGSLKDRHSRWEEPSPDNDRSHRDSPSCSSSLNPKETLFSVTRPEYGYSGKTSPQDLSPLRKGTDIIEISDSSDNSLHHKKRSRTEVSESDLSEINGEVNKKERKKAKRKHHTHRQTGAEESRHSHEKRKHKKSKKAKKHKSKKSGRSSSNVVNKL